MKVILISGYAQNSKSTKYEANHTHNKHFESCDGDQTYFTEDDNDE